MYNLCSCTLFYSSVAKKKINFFIHIYKYYQLLWLYKTLGRGFQQSLMAELITTLVKFSKNGHTEWPIPSASCFHF